MLAGITKTVKNIAKRTWLVISTNLITWIRRWNCLSIVSERVPSGEESGVQCWSVPISVTNGTESSVCWRRSSSLWSRHSAHFSTYSAQNSTEFNTNKVPNYWCQTSVESFAEYRDTCLAVDRNHRCLSLIDNKRLFSPSVCQTTGDSKRYYRNILLTFNTSVSTMKTREEKRVITEKIPQIFLSEGNEVMFGFKTSLQRRQRDNTIEDLIGHKTRASTVIQKDNYSLLLFPNSI